jgi:hypothetical protein
LERHKKQKKKKEGKARDKQKRTNKASRTVGVNQRLFVAGVPALRGGGCVA